MNLSSYSTADLLILHSTVAFCLLYDDADPSANKRYGCRTLPDWKRWADALEAEVALRGFVCGPIRW